MKGMKRIGEWIWYKNMKEYLFGQDEEREERKMKERERNRRRKSERKRKETMKGE